MKVDGSDDFPFQTGDSQVQNVIFHWVFFTFELLTVYPIHGSKKVQGQSVQTRFLSIYDTQQFCFCLKPLGIYEQKQDESNICSEFQLMEIWKKNIM